MTIVTGSRTVNRAPLTDLPDESVPLAAAPDSTGPLTDILEVSVPLADIPEEAIPLADIPDEDIPLADVPKTGDSGFWTLMTVLSGLGLTSFSFIGRKKDENA